jgi:hypothetical protein
MAWHRDGEAAAVRQVRDESRRLPRTVEPLGQLVSGYLRTRVYLTRLERTSERGELFC